MRGLELIEQLFTATATDLSFSSHVTTACLCLSMSLLSSIFPMVKNQHSRKLEALFWGLFTLLSVSSLYFELGHPANEQFVSLVFPIFLIGSCFLMLVIQVVWHWCIAYCLLGVFAGSLGVLASKVANLAFEKDQIIGLNFVVGAVVVLVGGYINLWERKKNVKVYSAFVAFCLSLLTALRVVLAFGAGAMGLVIGIFLSRKSVCFHSHRYRSFLCYLGMHSRCWRSSQKSC
jgi:uncharacterized membrane protein/energy-converting hydrogenase Eha subunit A